MCLEEGKGVGVCRAYVSRRGEGVGVCMCLEGG